MARDPRKVLLIASLVHAHCDAILAANSWRLIGTPGYYRLLDVACHALGWNASSHTGSLNGQVFAHCSVLLVRNEHPLREVAACVLVLQLG